MAGELTASERADRSLDVELLPPGGLAPMKVDSETDSHGYLELSISLPADAPSGWYAVRVAGGGSEGRARFEVS